MPLGNIFFENVSLVRLRVYAPCINRMPDGVIVGDSGLCCCVPVLRVTSVVGVLLLVLIPMFVHCIRIPLFIRRYHSPR